MANRHAATTSPNGGRRKGRALTPYDTGRRLEPHPWRGVGAPLDPTSDRFGRVDFDDEEGVTLLTVYVERTGDGYTLHVEHQADGLNLTLEETR